VFMCTDCAPTEDVCSIMAQSDVEFRVMPSGDGRWRWEVILGRTVIKRGTAETEPAACRQASEAAREAKLID
jgi:hypothetical protein